MTADRMDFPREDPGALIKDLLELTNDVVYTHDLEGNLTFLNRAGELLSEYSRDEIRGLNIRQVLTPESYEEALKMIRSLREGRPAALFEVEVVARDGRRVWLEVNARLRGPESDPQGILGIGRDVTARRKAKEALRESERKYRVLVENIPDLILRFDRSCRCLFAGDSWLAYLAPEGGETLGRSLWELGFPEALARRMEQGILSVFAAGNPVESEFVLRGAVVHCRLSPELSAEGQVNTVIAVARDITRLRQSEESYQRLFEKMLDGFALHEMIYDHEGRAIDYRFLAANPAFEIQTGLRVAEILGRTARQVLPKLEDLWIETYAEVVRTGRPAHFEDYSAGLRRHFEVNAYRTAPHQFAAIFTDVSERRRAELAWRENEALLRGFFESPGALRGILELHGEDLVHVSANAAAAGLFGETRLSMRGKTARELGVAEESLRLWISRCEECRLSRRAVRFEYERPCSAGPVQFSVVLSPLGPGPQGRDRVAYSATDVTEQRRMEERLRRTLKMEAAGRLAGAVAPEFNNLLMVINGYCDLLLGGPVASAPLRTRLEQIRGAGKRAVALTRQLLALSSRQLAQPGALNLNGVIVEAEAMLGDLVGEDIRLTTALDPGAGNVRMDRGQARQMLANLGLFARDALPEGGRLHLETAPVAVADDAEARQNGILPGPYVRLSVAATGPGLDPSARLLDPSVDLLGPGESGGLGLAVVYSIARQSGGDLHASSEPGRSVTLAVYLPRTGEAETEMERPGPLPAGGAETILLVEDQPQLLAMARVALEGQGYRVLAAASGPDALAQSESHAGPIHLLLTDVVMPGMNGPALAEKLTNRRPATKVIYMSGYSGDAVERRGILAERCVFLQKPVSPAELAAKIREVLGPPPRPSGMILVVDDEAGVRGLLREILTAAGYLVAEAENGNQAVRLIRSRAFDLMITDLVMPEQEGLETIQLLRRQQPDLRIIAISGAFGGSFLKVAKSLGAHAALAKPVSPEELLETVRQVLAADR